MWLSESEPLPEYQIQRETVPHARPSKPNPKQTMGPATAVIWIATGDKKRKNKIKRVRGHFWCKQTDRWVSFWWEKTRFGELPKPGEQVWDPTNVSCILSRQGQHKWNMMWRVCVLVCVCVCACELTNHRENTIMPWHCDRQQVNVLTPLLPWMVDNRVNFFFFKNSY